MEAKNVHKHAHCLYGKKEAGLYNIDEDVQDFSLKEETTRLS